MNDSWVNQTVDLHRYLLEQVDAKLNIIKHHESVSEEQALILSLIKSANRALIDKRQLAFTRYVESLQQQLQDGIDMVERNTAQYIAALEHQYHVQRQEQQIEYRAAQQTFEQQLLAIKNAWKQWTEQQTALQKKRQQLYRRAVGLTGVQLGCFCLFFLAAIRQHVDAAPRTSWCRTVWWLPGRLQPWCTAVAFRFYWISGIIGLFIINVTFAWVLKSPEYGIIYTGILVYWYQRAFLIATLQRTEAFFMCLIGIQAWYQYKLNVKSFQFTRSDCVILVLLGSLTWQACYFAAFGTYWYDPHDAITSLYEIVSISKTIGTTPQ